MVLWKPYFPLPTSGFQVPWDRLPGVCLFPTRSTGAFGLREIAPGPVSTAWRGPGERVPRGDRTTAARTPPARHAARGGAGGLDRFAA